jgi:predicted  nucleic acid-binding Zn-ribbon protein
MAVVKLGKLATAIIAEKGMSKEDKFQEKTLDRISDYIIDTEAQISDINVSVIPKLDNALKQAQRAQSNATKAVTSSYQDLGYDFGSYIHGINNAKDSLDNAKAECARIKAEIADNKALGKVYTELLGKLTA